MASKYQLQQEIEEYEIYPKALRELIKNKFPRKEVFAVGNPSSRFKFMGDLDKIDYDLINYN